MTKLLYSKKLDKKIAENIVRKEADLFRKQLSDKEISFDITDNAAALLAEKGYSDEFGARNISRVFREEIKDRFIDTVLFGDLQEGGSAVVDEKGGELEIRLEGKSGK